MLELGAFEWEVLKVFIYFLAQDYMRTLFYDFFEMCFRCLGVTGVLQLGIE